MDALEQLCHERGLRLTTQRRVVLEVLEAAGDHPCTHEIHRRAARGRRIGMATVYRVLNRFVAAGIVTRHVFADGKARYERTGRAPHPHLIDVASGEIVEVGDGGLARLLAEEAGALGYRLVEYRLKLFGRKLR